MTARKNDSVEIAVTGKSWMGKGTGSISSLIEDSLNQASEEVVIAAYAITDNSADLLGLIEKLLVKGISVLFVVNRLENQPDSVKQKLIHLNDNFEKLVLKDFAPASKSEDLHAKMVVIDHATALIGSANLTWKGMILNHEIMIRIDGRSAWELGNLVDRLAQSHDSRTIEKVQR